MDYYRPTLELPVGGRATEVKNTGQSCRRARWRVELLSEETVTVSETCSTFSRAGRCKLTPLHGLI